MSAQQIWNSLNAITAALNWLESRGISMDKASELIGRAKERGTPLTVDEVQAELDASQKELDETQTMIDTAKEKETKPDQVTEPDTDQPEIDL